MGWALLVGAIVTGFTAGDTNSWWFNWLVGIVPGFFAWLVTWVLLEGLAWNQRPENRPKSVPSNVRTLPSRHLRDELGRPE
jgi:hypothetical protein